MKLTIEMQSQTSFKILEQNTGKTGWISEPLYKSDLLYICQRTCPEFKTYGDNNRPTLYLQGDTSMLNEYIVCCGQYIYTVLYTLKKVFDEFKILNCNKFILEK